MVEKRYDDTDVPVLLTVPIADVMVHLGYSDRHQGEMYFSPFRQEKIPSFHINRRCNIWYDFGASVGGGVLDLVKLLLGCSGREAMNYLSDIKGIIPPAVQSEHPEARKRTEGAIRILKEHSPVINPVLVQYACRRGISPDILNRYCKEIVYEISGTSNRLFHAIGFPNSEGGYVLRSPRYKRCTASAPTWIGSDGSFRYPSGGGHLCVFEGFMDFLSWKMIESQGEECDCCVLNSVTNLGKTLTGMKGYDIVRTFLDNDEAGLKAFSQLAQALEMTDVSISDMSGLYEGYNDLNEMLVNTVTHFNT